MAFRPPRPTSWRRLCPSRRGRTAAGHWGGGAVKLTAACAGGHLRAMRFPTGSAIRVVRNQRDGMQADRGDYLFRADDALSHRQRNPADLSLVHELGLLGWVGAVENLRGPQATDQHRRERACRPSSEVASSGEFTGAVNGSTNGGASACTRVSSRCAVFTCPFFFLPLLLLPRCLEET